MSNSWIYRVGLSENEVSEESLIRSGLKFNKIEVESALREHIDETLDKPYKFDTSMRKDAPDFFSCSSLISYLYTYAGIWMPSVAIDKFFYSKRIEKSDLRFGDLVFSCTPKGDKDYPRRTTTLEYMPGKFNSEIPITHVGMYLEDGKILHASGNSYRGKVVIEKPENTVVFEKIVGYGRVTDDLKERRYVIEIPDDRPDLRKREALIEELKKNDN